MAEWLARAVRNQSAMELGDRVLPQTGSETAGGSRGDRVRPRSEAHGCADS